MTMSTSGLPMKKLTIGLAVVLSVSLPGCSDQETSTSGPRASANVGAGKAIAERECKGCHGLDGKGAAVGIPHLAAQRWEYLVAALNEYRTRKRTHAALKDIAEHLSEAETRNVAAYYASLPPIATAADVQRFSPYENGKVRAAACTTCHGENGNSTTSGTPSLAGQQPRYFVIATQEYLNGVREKAPMHSLVRDLDRLDLESLALYFASQTPAQRSAPPFGSAAAGEPLSAACGGCHGAHGVSTDPVTPNLAGQDAQYLVDSMKAYRKARRHDGMQRAVAGLSDKDIENIAAFYAVQKSRAAEKGETLVQELSEKCNRCHRADRPSATMAIPNIRGQDKDYLVMALRAYRDDRRVSSVMHKMSLPYGDAVIESLASFYASRPER
jgi:cytochrome c553